MATGTAKPTATTTPANDAERFIEQQLAKTRFQVRVVDLASCLMALAAAVLVYVLVLAIVDHWLMPLAWWGRWLACIALLGAVGYYLAVVVVPLMLRPINPVYAARAIEEAEPTLKNSLINFLMFRDNRGSLHQLVFSALQQRAATDLHRVPIDGAVDRSKVIHFGYLLAGVLALCAAYTILSPKDPLQSASRVLAPWADIDRPTRVRIEEVQPGNALVFQGDPVAVSCTLAGQADAVTLYFSTIDGEIVDQPVEMKLADDGRHFECDLAAEPVGLQQAVRYRIEAGDALSPTYQIEVSPAPHITVQSVEYDFPAYTNRPRQIDEGQGDIKGLEGTVVTIRAKANQPIRSAYVELQDASGNISRLPMELREQAAWRQITLALEADRKTPRHGTYQLRFTTENGRENAAPILHRIEVLPDLPPELSILTPRRQVTEVPQDGAQTIEVRAIDPDYGLTAVRLQLVMGATQPLDKVLLAEPQGRGGQVVTSYEFRPHLLGLQPGERVVYRAIAEDNRTAVGGDSPEPNQARTQDQQFLIIPPNKDPQSPGGEKESDSLQPDRPQQGTESDSKSTDGSGDKQAQAAGNESAEKGESGGEQQDQSQSGTAGQAGAKQDNDQSSSGGAAEDQTGQDGAAGGQPQQGQAGGGEQSGGAAPQQADGAGGESGRGGAQGPSEPLHDGEVFEKTLERLQQQAQQAGRTGQGQTSSGEPQGEANEQGDGAKTTGGNAGATKGASNGNSKDGSSGDKLPNGDEKASSKQQAEPQAPGKGSRNEDSNLGSGAQQQGAIGEGGSSKKPDRPTGKNGAEPDDGDERQAPGPKDLREKEPGAGDSGQSGAGQNSQETTGTGAVEAGQDAGKPGEKVENHDRPKNLQPDSSQPQEKDDPGSTRDKRQSDSQGESSGDRSGGGKKGPGQGANQAGNDSAGQNNAADQGAGAATESGQGDTSSAAGDKQRGEGQTGSAGSEKGAGSATRSDPAGDQSGSGRQPPPSGDRQDAAGDTNPNGSAGGPQQGRDGLATGGGLPADDNASPAIDKLLDVPPGDEANLEYARRATDLVLEHLRDQQDNPDRGLLKELGWTEAELSAFLQRWQQMKQAAREDDAGRRELDESLRSLGLRPARDRVRQGGSQSDGATGLRDTGPRTAPPAAYQELFDAFKKGAARTTP